MSTVSPNGMIANAATAVRIEISGASAKSQPIDVRGRNCSLVRSLTMSAIGCSDAERADAVGAVAVLEAPEQLALDDSTTGTSCRPTAKITIALRICIHHGS